MLSIGSTFPLSNFFCFLIGLCIIIFRNKKCKLWSEYETYQTCLDLVLGTLKLLKKWAKWYFESKLYWVLPLFLLLIRKEIRIKRDKILYNLAVLVSLGININIELILPCMIVLCRGFEGFLGICRLVFPLLTLLWELFTIWKEFMGKNWSSR